MTSETCRRTSPFRDVLGYTIRHWLGHPGLLAGLCAAMVAATMADVVMPLFASRLIDALADAAHPREMARDTALRALGWLIALGAAMIGLRHLAFLGIIRLTLHNMSDVAAQTFARVQRFSTDWHANSFAGSIVRKVTRGMWALDALNDTLLLVLLPSLVVLLGSTLLLGLRWLSMGLLVAMLSLLFVGLAVILSLTYAAPAARLSNMWDTRVGGALADAITCNAVVKGFGAEAREDARLQAVVRKWRRRTQRTWTRLTISGTAQISVLLVLRSAVIGAALLLWWRGAANAGDAAYVLTMYFIVQGYLRDIGYHVQVLQRSINDMEDLVALHGEALGVADRPDAVPIRITEGRVEFERVTFRYGAHATPLYSGLSVTIGAGERVGLVGHSGSGKTTFVKLLQRLYDVTAGRILIDGQDIAAAQQASLRAQIAVVHQEPVLFHRSLAENIAYGRPNATRADIEQAARLANAHDFIAALPKGYATLVGERGVKLSGGERQRVALASAFLADAPILILDEATSSLDSESEAMIQQAMMRLLEGRTAIVIAHRLSTVRALDRILVFDRGRIVEEGTHGSLRRHPGIYRRLFDRQAEGLSREAAE